MPACLRQSLLAAACRDVKPGNLLLDWASWFDPEDGAAWQGARLLQLALKLGDMGLATRHGLAGVDKVYAGTPGWWAPEVAEGHGTDTLLTGAVDIWAIGLVFAACRCAGPLVVRHATMFTAACCQGKQSTHLPCWKACGSEPSRRQWLASIPLVVVTPACGTWHTLQTPAGDIQQRAPCLGCAHANLRHYLQPCLHFLTAHDVLA